MSTGERHPWATRFTSPDPTLESVQVDSIRLLPTRLQPLGQIRTTSVAGRRRPWRVRRGQEHRNHRSGEVGRRGRTAPDGVEPRTSWARPLDAARLAGSRRRQPERCRRQDRPGPCPPGQRKASQSSSPTTPCRRSSRRASRSGAGVAMQRRRSLTQGSCRGRCTNGAQDAARGFHALKLLLAKGAAVLSPGSFDCQCRPGRMGDLHPVLAPQGLQLAAIRGKR